MANHGRTTWSALQIYDSYKADSAFAALSGISTTRRYAWTGGSLASKVNYVMQTAVAPEEHIQSPLGLYDSACTMCTENPVCMVPRLSLGR